MNELITTLVVEQFLAKPVGLLKSYVRVIVLHLFY